MIVECEAPTRRAAGRRPRLSDEDLADLATTISAGRWGSEEELADTKTMAYQRAKSARKLLAKIHNLTNVVSSITEVDVDGAIKFRWAVGPAPTPSEA